MTGLTGLITGPITRETATKMSGPTGLTGPTREMATKMTGPTGPTLEKRRQNAWNDWND